MKSKMLLVFFIAVILQSCTSGQKRASIDPEPMKSTGTNLSSNQSELQETQQGSTAEVERGEMVKSEVRDTAQASIETLRMAIRKGDDSLVFSEATKILESQPKDVVALNALAIYHYKKGQFDLALALEKEALKYKANVADFYSNQGVFYLAKNEERLAIESFRKALEIDSTHVEASVNLGGIYLKGFDYDRAYVAFENAFEKGHREFRFLLNYAAAARQKGKYSLSEDIYKGLLKQQPHHRESLYNYSLLLIEGLKNYDKGLDVIQKLKFIGEPKGTHNKIKQLEEIAKGGVR